MALVSVTSYRIVSHNYIPCTRDLRRHLRIALGDVFQIPVVAHYLCTCVNTPVLKSPLQDLPQNQGLGVNAGNAQC